MRVTTFAAINIGSYELTMKVYEINEKGRLRTIDSISYRIDLGRDTYTMGKISFDKMNELCEQLMKFKEMINAYKADGFRICATSAIRETENTILVLEQIKTKTGMKVEVLSNSEQRFLQYKALAIREEYFGKMIRKKTAVADIGGGSLQMSLFDKDRLITTQNMRLGAVRIKERLADSSYRSTKYVSMIRQLIENDLEAFDRLYIQRSEIQNMIIIGEVAEKLIRSVGEGKALIPVKKYMEFYEEAVHKPARRIGEELGIPPAYEQMIYPVMVLLQAIAERTGAEELWAPGISLCDGMVYDYAVSKKLIEEKHNFEDDILASADRIAARYKCNRKHVDAVRRYALQIFDVMKKVHGLGKRERLLLEIITILHDCGKYISLMHAPKSAYNIIMSTEIIGLSHLEREIVANTVMYNTLLMDEQERVVQRIGEKAYLTVYKLAAIVRIANVLDRSHRQKIEKMRAELKDGELIIRVDIRDEFELERLMFEEKARFFEETFCIKPVLRTCNIRMS